MEDEEENKDAEEQKAPQKKENEREEDYREKMLRIAAEFDNYKKRVKNDVDNAKGIGKAEMIKGILPVLDEFELALMHTNEEGNQNVNKGIEMVYSNLVETLKKAGLTEMKTNGMFDPYKHEIVMTREDLKKKSGTILEVVKKGYTFNGMVLRPASVIVAKEKEETEDKSEK